MEGGIMGDRLSLFERADNGIAIPADPKVQPHLALLLGRRKRGHDIVA